MHGFAVMNNLDVWYAHMDVETTIGQFGAQLKPGMAKRTAKTLAKARTRDSMAAFSKLTETVDGRVRIVDQSPLIVPLAQLAAEAAPDELFEGLHQLLRDYRMSLEFDRRELLEQFELADFARKVVGVGSVGTRAWIALMLGRDGQDPLFLQMKEAEESVFESVLGPSGFSNHGERVVVGQRLMQAAGDPLLGWVETPAGRDFYVRQLRDMKVSADLTTMSHKKLTQYAEACGLVLAHAHARTGDPALITGYLGKSAQFEEALSDFAVAYADQTDRDHAALVQAIKDGRVVAQTGI
jgi:uncharacterized protein (DUF2252 family)